MGIPKTFVPTPEHLQRIHEEKCRDVRDVARAREEGKQLARGYLQDARKQNTKLRDELDAMRADYDRLRRQIGDSQNETC